MQQQVYDDDGQQRASEDRLVHGLMDVLLGILTFLGGTLVVIAQMRALRFGIWGEREIVQILAIVIVAVAWVLRRRLSPATKVNLVAATTLAVGFAAFATLGVFAAGVFLLPLAVLVVALYHSARVTWIFVTAVISGAVLVAVAFAMGSLEPTMAAELTINRMNWLVYVGGMGFLVTFSATALLKYRQARDDLQARVTDQRNKISKQHRELEVALAELQTLQGIIPICAWCRHVRKDDGAWEQIESYVTRHSEASFSHGICPTCLSGMDDEE